MKFFSTLLAGVLFGTGLVVSGMADPAKVQNFLDLFGRWDPSLAFVMLGAIGVTMPGFWLVQKRATPFFSDMFHLPQRSDYDAHLVAGAATFGIGWGLGGFCPGPAITALPITATGTLIFVPAMLIGMAIAKYVALGVWCETSN
ncbi:MAG: YeeE/YedE family protein [Arenicellaceae bacterium]|nr:YeeE/YedE family protein [Arenicellaceae bacterium]